MKLDLINQGGIQNQMEEEKIKIKEFLNTQNQKFLNNPERRTEQTNWEMTINDPDMLHSLINDQFESGRSNCFYFIV